MGKQLHEVMGWPGPMTFRQYAAWNAWIDLQWNAPSRTDHYLMRVAQRVHQSFARGAVKLDDEKVEFVPAGQQPPDRSGGRTKGEIAEIKARWRRRLGNPIEVTGPGDGVGERD